ncbi:LacI family DNA-binding transcriptional regulator [Micromonospora mirobrigensis]|uniref:Transcriptional regulator, LacI family n=1 Tax=Micromonospora mirobrigensis TaxID=262898 RepID=A0A1C4Z6U5_9ACTN|nr:LacI family DNA-binding transcriptional regulator [Micromonospora mirobrigensis]SCF28351.1 transcriptional regulator, LacI family [Micromonospora mirobrigensis]
MPTTLKDVARLAEVSIKTVSNVVNDYPHVSDAVRSRVRAALAELDYRPNPTARQLRTGRTGMLALVLSGGGPACPDGLAGEVAAAAAERGYRVVVEEADALARELRPAPVDGVLLGADGRPPGPAGTPVVLLGGTGDGRRDLVAVDHARAAEDATAHLLRAGCRRVAAIGLELDGPGGTTPPYVLGYRRALDRAGLAPPAGPPHPTGRHRRAEGYRAARALLADAARPDGVVCASDPLAIGAMRAAFDLGLRVPEDVAVIGMGDSEEGRFYRPALSSVSVDTARLAREAVARIVARIARPGAPAARITVAHSVRVRASTGG